MPQVPGSLLLSKAAYNLKADQRTWRLYLPIIEVAFAYGLTVGAPSLFPRSFWEWQIAHLGCTPSNHLLFFFWMPLVICFFSRRSPSSLGITFSEMGMQFRMGMQSGFIVLVFAGLPAVLLAAANVGYVTWGGSFILSLLAIPMFLCVTGLPTPLRQPLGLESSRKAATILALTPVLAIAAMMVLTSISNKASYTVFVMVLTGLGEELLYRGYFQGRLNAFFGRPYTYQGISWGPGLVIAAILFGLSHPLFRGGHDWPWAIWTTAAGISFGVVREKARSILPAALAHGLLDLPLVFFG